VLVTVTDVWPGLPLTGSVIATVAVPTAESSWNEPSGAEKASQGWPVSARETSCSTEKGPRASVSDALRM